MNRSLSRRHSPQCLFAPGLGLGPLPLVESGAEASAAHTDAALIQITYDAGSGERSVIDTTPPPPVPETVSEAGPSTSLAPHAYGIGSAVRVWYSDPWDETDCGGWFAARIVAQTAGGWDEDGYFEAQPAGVVTAYVVSFDDGGWLLPVSEAEVSPVTTQDAESDATGDTTPGNPSPRRDDDTDRDGGGGKRRRKGKEVAGSLSYVGHPAFPTSAFQGVVGSPGMSYPQAAHSAFKRAARLSPSPDPPARAPPRTAATASHGGGVAADPRHIDPRSGKPRRVVKRGRGDLPKLRDSYDGVPLDSIPELHSKPDSTVIDSIAAEGKGLELRSRRETCRAPNGAVVPLADLQEGDYLVLYERSGRTDRRLLMRLGGGTMRSRQAERRCCRAPSWHASMRRGSHHLLERQSIRRSGVEQRTTSPSASPRLARASCVKSPR